MSNDSITLIYSVLKEVLASQMDQKKSLETKASMLIAFAGGMFALLMGARDTLITLSFASQVLLVVSIALFALSVILATIASWVRRYRADPNPEILAENYLQRSEQETMLQLTSNLIGVWRRNATLLESSASFVRIAFLAQSCAFVVLGVALFLSILH